MVILGTIIIALQINITTKVGSIEKITAKDLQIVIEKVESCKKEMIFETMTSRSEVIDKFYAIPGYKPKPSLKDALRYSDPNYHGE